MILQLLLLTTLTVNVNGNTPTPEEEIERLLPGVCLEEEVLVFSQQKKRRVNYDLLSKLRD